MKTIILYHIIYHIIYQITSYALRIVISQDIASYHIVSPIIYHIVSYHTTSYHVTMMDPFIVPSCPTLYQHLTYLSFILVSNPKHTLAR